MGHSIKYTLPGYFVNSAVHDGCNLLYTPRCAKISSRWKRKLKMTDYLQVFTTTGTKTDAQAIASAVVAQRLAGCVQIVGPITSTYWWQAEIETAEEWLCVVKSRRDLYEALEKVILETHPYDVPEILAIPVITGSKSYLEWLDGELRT